MGAQVALEIQVANTSDAARKYLEENEKLQQVCCTAVSVADGDVISVMAEMPRVLGIITEIFLL